MTLVLCFLEAWHQRMPVITIKKDQPIYIIGDSISAGIGGTEKNWPDVWASRSGRDVTNLARPGATVSNALNYQLAGINSPNAIIFIEIGGNDLMGTTTSKEFHSHLDQLLSGLHEAGHQLVMFEIPLLPLCNSYGRSQRTLAEKYGVILIPKRFLIDVFETKGATLDGLHLSQIGHDEMARRVHEMVKESPLPVND